jgi:hypothetical protein
MNIKCKKYPPLLYNHPLVEDKDKCKVCGEVFKEGDIVTLMPIGVCGEENREKAKQGKYYNAVSIPIHWDCCLPFLKEE